MHKFGRSVNLWLKKWFCVASSRFRSCLESDLDFRFSKCLIRFSMTRKFGLLDMLTAKRHWSNTGFIYNFPWNFIARIHAKQFFATLWFIISHRKSLIGFNPAFLELFSLTENQLAIFATSWKPSCQNFNLNKVRTSNLH